MENLGGNTEFLCLGCGLQGICSTKNSVYVENLGEELCPKCGSRLITTRFFREKASQLVLSV
jgi:predicted RNA-binding Zn-ribbon protein involved in translation (DUF1610 family)